MTAEVTEEAWGNITVGSYEVAAPGDVTLRAGKAVRVIELVIGEGTVVTVELDPSL